MPTNPNPKTYCIKVPGKYLLLADLPMRGSNCCGTLPDGNTITITQINSVGTKCISPDFFDWMPCDLPVIPHPDTHCQACGEVLSEYGHCWPHDYPPMDPALDKAPAAPYCNGQCGICSCIPSPQPQASQAK